MTAALRKTFNLATPAFVLAGLVLSFGCKPVQQEAEVRDLKPGQEMSDQSKKLFADDFKDERKVVVIYYANDTYAPRANDPANLNQKKLTEILRYASGDADQRAKKIDLELTTNGTTMEEEQRQKLNLQMSVEKTYSELFKTYSQRVFEDFHRFNEVVDEDVAILTHLLCSGPSRATFPTIGGLAVFRNSNNAGALLSPLPDYKSNYQTSLRWESCNAGDEIRKTHQLARIPRFKEYPYVSQPLGNAFVFAEALEAVKKDFPPEKSRYILITKSHGSRDYAITPHLAMDLRWVDSPEKLEQITGVFRDSFKAKVMAKARGASAQGLSNDKADTPILSNDKADTPILSNDKADTPILATTQISTFNSINDVLLAHAERAKDVGVSKGRYIEILTRMGAGDPSQAMHFPIVVMEACKSDLNLTTSENPQNSDIRWVLDSFNGNYADFNLTNVGLLYTSDEKGLGYDEIKYQELMGTRYYNRCSDIQDCMKTFLDSKTR